MTLTKDISAKFAVAAVAVAMIFSAYAPAAQAQTTEDLQQMINDLLAQVAGLQSQLGGGDTGSTAGVASGICPYTWTRDLSQGSEGADVMKLQQFLNSNPDTRVSASGAGSVGAETMYYGPATAAAVSKMQVMYRSEVLTPGGLVNPTGYFGPSSRAKANALCVSAPTTGGEEEGEEGSEEEEEEETGSMSLQGEGTLVTFEIDDAEDEVEEGVEDEVVLEITAEAENGDIELSRLTMQLIADIANEELEPWDVFEEVSIWVDGDKVASFDASDEDDYLNEDDGTFRFSNLELVLEEDDEVEMLVAVSVQNSVDGADADLAQWNIDVLSARYFDADGVATTEPVDEMGDDDADTQTDGIGADDFTDITDGVNFDVTEAGADDAATIENDSDSPDSATLKVEDDRSESEDYLVHTFEIEVDDESSDLLLEDAYVWVNITNPVGGVASIDSTDVVAEITLTIDGQTETGDAVVNENAAIADGATVRVGYLFEFNGLDLEADETYLAEVEMSFEGADINVDPTLSAYDPGTSIFTDVDAQEVGARWQVEGIEDDFVLTGDDESEVHTLNTVVPIISNVDSATAGTDPAGTRTISFTFNVEADGEDDITGFDVADIVTTLTGTDITIGNVTLSRVAGDATETAPGSGIFTINDGDDADFAVDVTFTAVDAGDNGLYRATLESVLGVEVEETFTAGVEVQFGA